jgi:ergothioneine biosynthesis protein EgtB
MHCLGREALAHRHLRNRERSRALFERIAPGHYEDRPIPLRNPIVFYEGHLPVFSVNTLLKLALGEAGIDERFERIFARGIDPDDVRELAQPAGLEWPSRAAVVAYGALADERILAAIDRADEVQDDHPLVRGGLAAHTCLEHEAMHHETLCYLLHALPLAAKRAPAGASARAGGSAPPPATVLIPAGAATLGAGDDVEFAWDNERPAHVVFVPEFVVDVHDVTNREYLRFVEAGGYHTRAHWSDAGWAWLQRENVTHPHFWRRADGQFLWRATFGELPLPLAWPVWVTHAEASAYARWQGARLMTEAEFHRAAFGAPGGGERAFPWGDEPPDATRGNFGFQHWDPVPVGSYPAGASAFGVHDLYGNGWEWTASRFQPFRGFVPLPTYPGYSADFFDRRHFVLKGAAPATAFELVRRSFRNWFRPTYPWVHATFRCVR